MGTMAWMTRRRFLWLAGGGVVALGAARFGLPRLLRPSWPRPLSAEARAFAEECFAGIDRSRCWDTHVHLVGLGAGGTGCWINPEMQSHLHPIERLRYEIYTSSLGMDDPETADADYLERLLALQRQANPQGKLLLMAFDQVVDENGAERPELSSFFTPNEYALKVARQHDDVLAVASIHPYRTDALERLEATAEAGARAVKWLPNSMRIDPASPLCDPFYERLVSLGLPLITHGGLEFAVDSEEAQELGNPLLLRRPLDAGVRVVVAHCAGLGDARDLDRGGSRRVEAVRLLLRLMEDPRYEEQLFADISGLTQINRGGPALREILRAQHLHRRLVNGSDYPIAALRVLFSTTKLQLEGLIDGRQRVLINEIGQANPLLFDFVLKRSLTLERDGQRLRFADSVFETDWLFG